MINNKWARGASVAVMGLACLLSSAANAQSICSTIDNEQARLNGVWSSVNIRYPGTMAFLGGCLSDSYTDESIVACMAGAFAIADSCWFAPCDTSGPDWAFRMGTFAMSYSQLRNLKAQYPGCVLYVRDLAR